MVMLDSLALVLALSSVGQVPMQPAGVGETVLVDFTATWCGPCRSMQPTIERMAAAGYPVRQVDIDQNPALAARYHVTSVPCFVMIVDGREVDRVVGMASYGRLEQMFGRARVEPPGRPRALGLGQSPDNHRQVRPRPGTASLAGQAPRATTPPTPTRISGVHLDSLVASTVRIEVDDKAGQSYGTGTIIDTRAGEALVLTCGHLFRDSKGKGPITIDLFGPGGSRRVAGRLISYDLSRDLGLVSIRPGGPVRVARVATGGQPIVRGNRVVSVGCNNGKRPTAQQTHVTRIDRYDGPPNIEVAGMPVEGRSGGGLFDQQGRLIGVCFAADSRDNEGLYVGLSSIHAELDRLGLANVYRAGEPAVASNAVLAQPPLPAMPKKMPSVDSTTPHNDVPVRQVASSLPPGRVNESDMRLSATEAAALSEIQARSHGAEVICIIRPNDPQAKSEIIVLNDVSPNFIKRLTSTRMARGTRQLTSLEVPERGSAPGTVAMPALQADAIGWRDHRR